MGRQPRQRPISCKLCRQRKLRCSRVFPCSNCICRGVECQHDGPSPTHSTDKQNKRPTDIAKEVSTTDLLERLEKLESLLASHTQTESQPPSTTQASSGPLSTPTVSISSPIPPQLQKLTDDALFLERSCSGSSLVVSNPLPPRPHGDLDQSNTHSKPQQESLVSDPLVFRPCAMSRITKQPSFIFQTGVPSSPIGTPDIIKCIWIPLRHESHTIADKYASDVDHFHHVIHRPSLGGIIDSLYDKIETNSPFDIGAVVLLLCITAASTYAWSLEDNVRQLFNNLNDARSQAILWVKAALDAIDHAHRTASASLECIQGMTILFFVFCSLEGLSNRARSLVTKSIAMARELGLHRLDAPTAGAELSKMGLLRAEMARRIWWFLVATDWMMAQFAATVESTYTIHPSHMAVKKPLNVNDEELTDDMKAIGRPLQEPTRSSAILHRIRLAELCRGLLDKYPNLVENTEELDYTYVMDIDAKLRTFLRELPDYLSLDITNPTTLRLCDRSLYHGIIVQRYTLNLMVHRHLCKLHLPYLARGSVETAFSYSREACLFSARKIVHAEKLLKSECLPFSTTRLRSIMIIRSVFLASIVLVLNACLNTTSDEERDRDTEYLTDSWSILEDAKDQSLTAAKLLDLSRQVLRRHSPNHVSLSNVEPPDPIPMTPESTIRQDARKLHGLPELGQEIESAYLDQQWQALEGRTDLSAIDWDKLFYGLDAPFI